MPKVALAQTLNLKILGSLAQTPLGRAQLLSRPLLFDFTSAFYTGLHLTCPAYHVYYEFGCESFGLYCCMFSMHGLEINGIKKIKCHPANPENDH